MDGATYLHKRGVYGASACNVRSNVSLCLLEKFSMGDPGTFWLITTPARDFKFFQVVVQRSILVMVAFTQKSFSPQYGWFCRGRSHMNKPHEGMTSASAEGESSLWTNICACC